MPKNIFYLLLLFIFCSCSSTKNNYDPSTKYAPAALQSDYTLLRNILEAKHPALYWYTPKEKMDGYFNHYFDVIKDSMTEQQFAWLAVAPLLNKIHCGHTSMSLSKAYSKWARGKLIPSFPLYLKVWSDTMAVVGNLKFVGDSVFKKGTLITSINGITNKLLIKYMFEFLSQDGYSYNVSYARLSANFPYYHRHIFGLSKTYTIGYLDNFGNEQKAIVPLYIPIKDTTKKEVKVKVVAPKISKKERLLQSRNLTIDSSKAFASMYLSSFSNGHLRRFFKRSFAQLQNDNIPNLIIDLRTNGGGKVGLSTLLTKYVADKKFKVADTLYATARGLGKYSTYVSNKFLNSIEMFFISRKNKDGKYHIRYLEKHFYKPRNNNYKGNIYLLTAGPTFSASAIFCNAVKGQKNISLLGEETGGGWYGNSGIIIPDIKLPNTKIKVRLPLYKLVQVNKGQKKGTGVLPDIYVPTSYEAFVKGYDKKMEEVKKLILNRR